MALSTDLTIERDFQSICHSLPINLFVNRIHNENPLTKENLLKMYDQLESITEKILPGEKINTVAYGCTSGTIAIGEDKIKEKIQSFDTKIAGSDFWKDKLTAQKILKEKKFLENIFSFYNGTEKELADLKDLNKLALEEGDNLTLNDCSKKISKVLEEGALAGQKEIEIGLKKLLDI